MSVINPHKIADILIEATELYILPRFQMLQDHEISSKSHPDDLVTQADLDVEAHLKRVLPDLYPGSYVIGEEGISTGEDTLDILKDDTQTIWLADPVDGTRNFVNARPEFGVMLACIIDGQTQLSWIYDVMKKDVYIAENGSGAYQNDTRLKVKPVRAFNEQNVHMNLKYFPKDFKDNLKEMLKIFNEHKSLGCSAHEYTRIARGDAQASFYARSRIWDNLPGTLLVKEAGGYIAKIDKTPLQVYDDKANLIVTTDEDNWNRLRTELQTHVNIDKFL